MNKAFEFTSFTAINGRAFKYKSNAMFENSEDEKKIRNLVERAFAGETVKLPGYQVCMVGEHNGTDFSFKLFTSRFAHLSQGDIPRIGVLLYIYGTTSIGSKRTAIASENLQNTLLKPYGVFSTFSSQMKLPKTAYSVDILNPLGFLNGDESFCKTGMTGQFSKAIACIAIDILLGAKAAGQAS